MKRVFPGIAFLLFLSFPSLAQSLQRHKIAVFAPLYLDSVFDAGGNMKFEKNNLPKFVVPGLEFYQGVETALDSLQKRGVPLEVFVLDSRGKQSPAQQLASPELKGIEMLIASSNASETNFFAAAAQQRKIPFISITLPNDAGITNDPYLVILNSTLPTHVEGIYRFLQKYHGQDRIVVFKKPGAQEEQLQQEFMDCSKNTVAPVLNIKFVNIGSNFIPEILAAHLDSTRKNVCIAGSLDESFAQKLTQNLSSLNHTYPIRVIGMPTWENMNFNKFGDLEILYTTPFFYNRSSLLESKLAEDFTNSFSTKPSDIFFRGYETMLRFGLLLVETKKDIASNLTRKGYTVLTPFDIQPVFKNKSAMTLDYFENKHLYFIKVFGGVKNILY
ncbi:MAG: ABC transporter substrate-binding protein [Flavisolibacter sp.]